MMSEKRSGFAGSNLKAVFMPVRGNCCPEAKTGPREAHKGPIEPTFERVNADAVHAWVHLGLGS